MMRIPSGGKMELRTLREEKGQAAVFVTILLMFALIALTALAIDGGHLYVVRRDLQNMADAACLAAGTELARGGDDTTAIQVAREYVIRNGGEFFSAWNSPSDNVGSGSGLTWGIEVTDADVRVALQTVVDTYFTMIFNRTAAGVGAGAHCNSRWGGGLLPIAVRRYEYVEEDPTQQLDVMANRNCQPPDCYYGNDFEEEYLPGYYGLAAFRPITNSEWIPQPGTLGISTTGNIDCDLPPQDGVLDGVCVLGVHPETNDGTAKFSGFVGLDIRNITAGCPPDGNCGIQYYNGATGQDATTKDLASEWFCSGGYRGLTTGWRLPVLGDQLAFLPGVSAHFGPSQMMDCGWKVGDQFVAVIYSGYVWDVPDLEVSIEPKVNEVYYTDLGDTHTVTYTVTLEKPPESKAWEGAANFQLDAFLLVADDPANPITPTIGLQPSVWFPGDEDVITVPLTITVTDFLSETTYLTAVTVQARDSTYTNLSRWASTNFMYGDVTKDFTFYPGQLEFVIEQGNVLHIPITTRGFGWSENKAKLEGDLCGASAGIPWPSVFSTNQADSISILDGQDSKNKTFDLGVNEGATPGPYDVCLTIRKGNKPEHTVQVRVNVISPLAGGTPTRFVMVEGFAPFEISYIDVNDVVAFAVGPIEPDLSKVTGGTRAALLPW